MACNLAKLCCSLWALLTLCICSISSEKVHLSHWDVAVFRDSNLTLFDSVTNSSLNVHLPLFETALNAQNHSNHVLKRKRRASVVFLAPDASRKLVFIATLYQREVNFIVFNETTKSSKLIYKGSNYTIESLVYHDFNLFWIDSINHQVLKLNTRKFQNLTPEVVLEIKNSNLRGIAVNPSTGDLFWGNWFRDGSTGVINRFDGKEVHDFITGIHKPYNLVADSSFLYWVDNAAGVQFQIEQMSFVDPSSRTIIASGEYNFPTSIAVTCSNAIYWTTRTSRCVYKKRFDVFNSTAVCLDQFDGDSPISFATNQNPDCSYANKFTVQTDAKPLLATTSTVQVQPSSANSISIPKIQPTPALFISSGKHDSDRTSAPIKEVAMSRPTPTMGWCPNVSNVCQNGASCIAADDRELCLCMPGFAGIHCEHEWTTPETNTTPLSKNTMFAVSGVLAALVVLLILAVLHLVVKVRRLSLKPKIRRRVIVSRTSESNRGQSVCEMIDIENCCNMNVCETPCYERAAGCSSSIGRNSSSQKEDKQKLIDDM